MKSITSSILVFSLLTTSVFAFDISSDTSNSRNTGTEQSVNISNGKEYHLERSKGHNQSINRSISKSKSREVSLLNQVSIINDLKVLEEKGVQPYRECDILTHPKLLADFGITAINNNFGMESVDTYKSDMLEKAARYNQPLSSVDIDSTPIKNYINCVAFYGAIIAQGMKDNIKSGVIKDRQIKETFMSIQNDLRDSTCRFAGDLHDIVCGDIRFTIGYEPKLFYLSYAIFDGALNGASFYGYTSSTRLNYSREKRHSWDTTQGVSQRFNHSRSYNTNQSEKVSGSLDTSYKTNFSPRNWMPEF